MIHVRVARVRPDKLDVLKAWFAEAEQRADEVRATFEQEGVTHEQAKLISTADGPLLVYAVECADYEAAGEVFRNSTLPIDAEHKRVMAEVLDGQVDTPVLLDIHI
ncbi:hypothetical protein GCM10009610_35390 [Pseudonocardia xinjiangensis]